MVQDLRPARGLSGVPGYSDRAYLSGVIRKPRMGPRRDAAVGDDPLEQRAARVEGTILERIVFRRMTALFGPEGQQWVYKYQVGAGGALNARVFEGGVEMDFVFLSHPSMQEVDIEVQGANWHRDIEGYADAERALEIINSGRVYAEIWEYEIMLGDQYLDQRILDITQYQGRIPEVSEAGLPEVRTVRDTRRTRSAS